MRAVLTSEQEMLRDTAVGLAGAMSVNTPGDLLRVDRSKGWSALAGAGLLAMRGRDADGAPLGSGFDTALVAQALGGALAPAPFVGALLAYELLALVGAPEDWLTDIGGGAVRYGLLMAHGRAFLPPHLTGRGVTLLNFASIGGVGLMQFATGGVVTAYAVPGDPVAAYAALFWFYAIMLALSILIYLLVRDAKPEKPADEISQAGS